MTEKGNGCVGSYTVSGYTRGDGISVSSYTRTCGAAHNSSNNPTTSIPKQDLTDEEKMQRRADILYPTMVDTKYQKILDSKKIAGVAKGEPMSLEKAGNGVNPKFNPLITNSYSNNCQSCVAIFEARLRGYDVEYAIPVGIDSLEMVDKLSNSPNIAFRNSVTGKTPNFTKLNVNSAIECKKILMNRINIGERYIFTCKFKSNSIDEKNIGHILTIWKNSKNELKFFDSQSSMLYSAEFLEKIKFKYDRLETKIETKILRIDDKELNYDLLNVISKPANK